MDTPPQKKEKSKCNPEGTTSSLLENTFIIYMHVRLYYLKVYCKLCILCRYLTIEVFFIENSFLITKFLHKM